MAKAWNMAPENIPSDVEFNNFPEWDSLGHVSLLVALEKKYQIAIDYKVLTELTSITAIIDYLTNR